MKRMLSLALALLLLCPVFGPARASGFGFGDLEDLFGSVYNNSSSVLPGEFTLPGEFSITYEYAENGKYREVTLEKDQNDHYHYKDSENEYLFVKEGRGYRMAVKTVNGFIYKNSDKYTFDYVKEQTQLFWKCAAPLEDDLTLGTVTEAGQGQICGRKTDRFKVELGMGYSIGGYSVSMSEATYYDFDAETGICLASSTSENVSFMGMNSDDSDNGFECVRFEVRGIVLPAVQ